MLLGIVLAAALTFAEPRCDGPSSVCSPSSCDLSQGCEDVIHPTCFGTTCQIYAAQRICMYHATHSGMVLHLAKPSYDPLWKTDCEAIDRKVAAMEKAEQDQQDAKDRAFVHEEAKP